MSFQTTPFTYGVMMKTSDYHRERGEMLHLNTWRTLVWLLWLNIPQRSSWSIMIWALMMLKLQEMKWGFTCNQDIDCRYIIVLAWISIMICPFNKQNTLPGCLSWSYIISVFARWWAGNVHAGVERWGRHIQWHSRDTNYVLWNQHDKFQTWRVNIDY